MSRIAKMPIVIPQGVKVDVQIKKELVVSVTGPKGTSVKTFMNVVSVNQTEGSAQQTEGSVNQTEGVISITPNNPQEKFHVMMSGTVRSIINSMIKGVCTLFSKELVVSGNGYRAILNGKILSLSLGKNHATQIVVPNNINVTCPKFTQILITSINKEDLGHFVALVKKQRPVGTYKANGIYEVGTLNLKTIQNKK